MRILHLVGDRQLPRAPHSEGASGVVRAALEIARAQVRLGHEVYIAATSGESWRAEWEGIHLVGLSAIPGMPFGRLGRVSAMSQHLSYVLFTRRNAFDVIQGHLYSYMPYLNANLRVVHFHSDPFYKGKANEGFDLKSADFASIGRHSDVQIAVSRFVAGELKRGFNGLSNIHVVYNGVDATLFNPGRWETEGARLRQEWGVGEGEVVLLFSGAVVPEKGVVHLARAFSRLAECTPYVHLVIAGAGWLWGGMMAQDGLESEYEAEVKHALSMPLQTGRAHILGKVATSHMPAIYHASDAVVVPSVCREGFCLAAVEAMASERPVVASGSGGLLEIVGEQSGILVPPGDEAALEAAMSVLAANPDFRRRVGLAAREEARRFSWEVAAKELNTIYANTLEAKMLG